MDIGIGEELVVDGKVLQLVDGQIFLFWFVEGDDGHIILLRQSTSNNGRNPLYPTNREDTVNQEADSFHFFIYLMQKYK
jgi:hypothetical protein